MTRTEKTRKPKAGLLLFATQRFKNLGEGTKRGTYHERKTLEVKAIVQFLENDLDVVYPGIIYSREDVEAAMQSFLRENVDFIISEFLSWSEDFAWVRFVRDMPDIPMLLFSPTREIVELGNTFEEDEFIEFLSAGTLVGSLEASLSLKRLKKDNVQILLGDRQKLIVEIKSFARAALTRSILKKARFGILANYNELMWSTYVDPFNLFARVGPELNFISHLEYAALVAQVQDASIDKYLKQLTSLYKIDSDVNPKLFVESIRASLALADLITKKEIDALIFNDVDPHMLQHVGLRPGFYHPSINEQMSVMVPEADVGAGTMAFILKVISGKHISFIEPFHMERSKNTFSAGHAGPHDYNDPAHAEKVLIARDVRFAKTKYKFAGAPFAWYRIPAGLKTMAHFSEDNGQYKIACALVESFDGPHLYASYSHSIFKSLIPVEKLFERMLHLGTTQHFLIVDGDYRKELSMLAAMMNFEFHELV